MVNSHFLLALALTLVFSFFTSFFYYFRYHKRDVSVAIILYGLFVFFIVYFVSFENNIGLGIGLLGILSLIRLRSTPENLIDIGLIFYAITIGLLNASIGSLYNVVFLDLFLTVFALILSSRFLFPISSVNTEIVLDDVEFSDLSNNTKLIKMIQKRFKIVPIRVKIVKIDYIKDSLVIKITYNAKTY